MDKDIITVSLADGSKRPMEMVLTYTDSQTKQNYVLYKELDKNDECYAAKYEKKDNTYELDTDLTKKEIDMLQIILDSMLKGGN